MRTACPLRARHNDFRWVGCPRVHRKVAYRNPNRILSPTGMPQTQRAAMAPSRTLSVGMDVHIESIAVAYVAHAHGAEVISLGPVGTRQGDIAKLIRQLRSKSTPLGFVYEAGPYGYWRSRSLTKPG